MTDRASRCSATARDPRRDPRRRRGRVRAAAVEQLADVVGDDGGDTIYAIDRVSEDVLLEPSTHDRARRRSCVLVAEGLGGAASWCCRRHDAPPTPSSSSSSIRSTARAG